MLAGDSDEAEKSLVRVLSYTLMFIAGGLSSLGSFHYGTKQESWHFEAIGAVVCIGIAVLIEVLN